MVLGAVFAMPRNVVSSVVPQNFGTELRDDLFSVIRCKGLLCFFEKATGQSIWKRSIFHDAFLSLIVKGLSLAEIGTLCGCMLAFVLLLVSRRFSQISS